MNDYVEIIKNDSGTDRANYIYLCYGFIFIFYSSSNQVSIVNSIRKLGITTRNRVMATYCYYYSIGNLGADSLLQMVY